MHNLKSDADELKSLLKTIMRQPYVEKYIKNPFIDNNKIMFLTEMNNRIELSTYKKNQMMATVMLVQTALDTHELIPASNSTNMPETEKQLSVLAGDYYSGLYYLSLAEIDQLEMIRILANAIKQINELKMKLYYDDMNSISDLFSSIMEVDTLLLTNVAHSFNMDTTFIQLIKKTCFINRLTKERELIKQQEFSYVYVYFKNREEHVNHLKVLQYIDVELEKQREAVDNLLSVLPYSFRIIKNELDRKFNLSYNTTLAEEG